VAPDLSTLDHKVPEDIATKLRHDFDAARRASLGITHDNRLFARKNFVSVNFASGFRFATNLNRYRPIALRSSFD
jgi:hypothetical protein